MVKLLFNKNMDNEEIIVFNQDNIGTKHNELLDLIDSGHIKEAENLLLDELDPNDIQDYNVALMFYSYLNEKNLDFLEEHNYSKKEIMDGIKYVSEIYGYGSMINTLLGIVSD
jgi:hypothetical protein